MNFDVKQGALRMRYQSGIMEAPQADKDFPMAPLNPAGSCSVDEHTNA